MQMTRSDGMQIVCIPKKEIKKFGLMQINDTIENWYSKQTQRPEWVINATLFSYGTYKPIGTVSIDGARVSDQGNGYGIGTTEHGEILCGRPYDRVWYDYLTGYPPLVVDGKGFDWGNWDAGVTNGVTNRSAVGMRGDDLYFITAYASCAGLRQECLDLGLDNAYNLDGGGSSLLLHWGVPVNKPTEDRKISTILAAYTYNEEPAPYQAKTKRQLSTYNVAGEIEAGRYVGNGDIIRVYPELSPNMLVRVEYPLIKGGWRGAFLRNLEYVEGIDG